MSIDAERDRKPPALQGMTQVAMDQGDLSTVAWIPTKSAVKGADVLLPRSSRPSQPWRITDVYSSK